MPQIVRERVQQRSALDGFQRNILGTLCILIVVALYRDEGTTFELQKSVQSALLPLLTKQTELMNLRGSGEHEVFWQWLQEAFLPVVLVHKDEDHSQGEDLSSWIRTYNQMTVQCQLLVYRCSSSHGCLGCTGRFPPGAAPCTSEL